MPTEWLRMKCEGDKSLGDMVPYGGARRSREFLCLVLNPDIFAEYHHNRDTLHAGRPVLNIGQKAFT